MGAKGIQHLQRMPDTIGEVIMDERWRDIQEWSEIERECKEMANFSTYGIVMYRFWTWMELKAKNQRLKIKDEINGR